MNKDELIKQASEKFKTPTEELNKVWEDFEKAADVFGFAGEDKEAYCKKRMMSYHGKQLSVAKNNVECEIRIISVRKNDYGRSRRKVECLKVWGEDPTKAMQQGFCDEDGNPLTAPDKNGDVKIIDLKKDTQKTCWALIKEKDKSDFVKQRIDFLYADWSKLPAMSKATCLLGKGKNYRANQGTVINEFTPLTETEIIEATEKFFKEEAIPMSELETVANKDGFDKLVIVRADLADIMVTQKGGRMLTINNSDAESIEDMLVVPVIIGQDQLNDLFVDIEEGAQNLIIAGDVFMSAENTPTLMGGGIYCPEMFRKKAEPEKITNGDVPKEEVLKQSSEVDKK